MNIIDEALDYNRLSSSISDSIDLSRWMSMIYDLSYSKRYNEMDLFLVSVDVTVMSKLAMTSMVRSFYGFRGDIIGYDKFFNDCFKESQKRYGFPHACRMFRGMMQMHRI